MKIPASAQACIRNLASKTHAHLCTTSEIEPGTVAPAPSDSSFSSCLTGPKTTWQSIDSVKQKMVEKLVQCIYQCRDMEPCSPLYITLLLGFRNTEAEEFTNCQGHQILPQTMDFGNKLIKMNEVEEALVLLKNLFYLNSGYLANFCPVVEIHRNIQFTDMRDASLDALFLFSRRRAGKDSTLGITYVWHSASKDVIEKILDNSSEASDSRVEPRILNLSKAPEHCAIDSIMKSTVDDNGMMYMLFCQVLSPLVHSEKFMAWNPHVDRHIRLLCVLTIKPSCSIEELRRMPIPQHISPLVSGKAPDSIALAMLPEFMSLPMMYLIRKAYNEAVEQKIERWVMILRWRQLAGEQLLGKISEIYFNKLRKAVEKKKQNEMAAASSQKNEQGGSSA